MVAHHFRVPTTFDQKKEFTKEQMYILTMISSVGVSELFTPQKPMERWPIFETSDQSTYMSNIWLLFVPSN